VISHTPWQEEELQEALVDWVITKDVSFANATLAELQGLLTRNWPSLLHALLSCASPMRPYILTSFEKRKRKVMKLLARSKIKISVSLDV
jgi:hypothetical protein